MFRTVQSQPQSTQELAQFARARANLTQREFAKATGIPRNTLKKWEEGTREPSQGAALFLALIWAKPYLLKTVQKAEKWVGELSALPSM